MIIQSVLLGVESLANLNDATKSDVKTWPF